MSPPIRLLLVDDHAVVREGLKALLEEQPDMRVVAEYAHASELIDALPTVQADPRLMGIVFQNLLSNAIKFTNGKPIKVEISASIKNNSEMASLISALRTTTSSPPGPSQKISRSLLASEVTTFLFLS